MYFALQSTIIIVITVTCSGLWMPSLLSETGTHKISRRSSSSHDTNPRGDEKWDYGVLYYSGHRRPKQAAFSPYIFECYESAVRASRAIMHSTSNVFRMNKEVKIALVTDRAPYDFMISEKCKSNACKRFQKGSHNIFHKILFFDDWHVPSVDFRMKNTKFQGFPLLWVKRFNSWEHSPFKFTLALDSDVHVCLNFLDLFSILQQGYDVAAVSDVSSNGGWGGSRKNKQAGSTFKKMNTSDQREYTTWFERNTGVVLLASHKSPVRLFARHAQLTYIMQVRDVNGPYKHDQPAFKEALFSMRTEVNHTLIADEHGCRKHNDCADGCLTVHRKYNVKPLLK